MKSWKIAIGMLVVFLVGCDAHAPVAAPANAPAPSAPPPPPPGSSTAAPSASPAPAPSAAAKQAPIPQLQPYWGNNYIVLAFAPSPDAAEFQKLRADWQAKQTDSQGQPIVFVQVIGETVTSASGQISGGESLDAKAVSNLWDVYFPSQGVVAVFVVGKDGKTIFDARRGGTINLAEALAPL